LDKQLPIKERLIIAGIQEIKNNGVRDFSLRRVSEECGVSCAAPYKHFKNKDDFILAIYNYINDMWYQIQIDVISKNPNDIKIQLIEISLAYIRFLVLNPNFYSLIMLNEDNMSNDLKLSKAQLSIKSRDIIDLYCKSVNMSHKDKVKKTFVVRSLIYGAALMFNNGEMIYSERSIEMVRETIIREFDIN